MRATLDKYVSEHENCRIVIADLGQFPKSEAKGRLVNVGFQEHNLINVAAGLANAGFRVFAYSVSGFTIHRAYESLKFFVSRGKDVTLINGGAGFCYNKEGFGHYLTDDFALIGALPNFRMFAPVNRAEFLETITSVHGPAYIRTSFDDAPELPCPNAFDIQYNGYFDPCNILITTGWLSQYHYTHTMNYRILHVPEIKKLAEYDKVIAAKALKVAVIEDHIAFGGLTTYLKETRVDIHICLPPIIDHYANSKEEFWKYLGLTGEALRD